MIMGGKSTTTTTTTYHHLLCVHVMKAHAEASRLREVVEEEDVMEKGHMHKARNLLATYPPPTLGL